MRRPGVIAAFILYFHTVSADTGVAAYTFEDYLTYLFGLLFIVLGVAIIMAVLKSK